MRFPVLVTAPTLPVVTLEEAKRHLRVDHDDDDALISGMIAAATNHLDPAGNGWLGRALRPQTWEMRLDNFPCGPIQLPYPPLISVESVKYDDSDGVERTATFGTDYRVFQGGDWKSRLEPVYGGSWPWARCDHETVRVRYTAGYAPADGDTPDALPATIKAAILLMVGDLYAFRETVATGGPAKVPVSTTVDALLSPLRVY
jgi:uncharacterized phiE125 gp8 family phage protein